MSQDQPQQSQGFSQEQQAYIQGLIAQLDLQAVFKPANTGQSEPQAISVHGTPYEDLCKEETLKHERHPWDVYTDIYQHAAQAKMPEGGDVFMFKHHGLFNVAPAQEGFMCRLRIPGCKLTGDQLIALGDIAQNLAGGYAHVTTRGNLQVREIMPHNMINLLTALSDAGLTSKGSGADSVRNITCSPTAGFDPHEVHNLLPNARELHHLILNSKDLHGIPRKFNIAFDCGGKISCVADTNDVAFVATKLNEQHGATEPGVYCRILLGGITGHLDFARDTGYLIKPEHTTAVAVEMLKVFIEHGDRTNRKKARLKYLLDAWGDEEFCKRVQERLDVPMHKVPAQACEERAPIDRNAHVGVMGQREPGTYCVGVALRAGRLEPDQLRRLGELAKKLGRNDVRLTVWQNLMIPHIHKADLDETLSTIEAMGLSAKASSVAAGAVACTGRFGCKYASAHTKEHAGQIIDHIDSRLELDTPVNIHLTGCVHSCAQHYIGDIGMLGASTEDGREAYQVFIGGGSDLDQGIASHLAGPVPAQDAPGFLEHVLRRYLELREPDEPFITFARRHSIEQLRELFLHDTPQQSSGNQLAGALAADQDQSS